MTALSFLVIMASVLLSAGSQVLLKIGMVSVEVREAIAQGSIGGILLAVATSPAIVMGCVCYGLSFLSWLVVLARIPLSTAYPFVALGIGVTVAAGTIILGEALSIGKIVGVVLILIGIVTVARA